MGLKMNYQKRTEPNILKYTSSTYASLQQKKNLGAENELVNSGFRFRLDRLQMA